MLYVDLRSSLISSNIGKLSMGTEVHHKIIHRVIYLNSIAESHRSNIET